MWVVFRVSVKTQVVDSTQYFNEMQVVGNIQYFSENSGYIPVSISMKTPVVDSIQYLQHTCQLPI